MIKQYSIRRDEIEEIEMDLTSLCNLKCYICTRNFKHSMFMLNKNVIRPMKDIIAQLDTFKGLTRFFIAGSMSEPTLHPEFFEFIKYLNSRNIYYELFTNGNTHDEAWWEELGKIIPAKCMVCFTVCGSTQALHSYYRVCSNLNQILKHASAFRKNNKHNDYCQHILFEYNKVDYDNGNMQKIFKQFSHSFQVHSEGRRLNDEKIIALPIGIEPPKNINASIKYIFDKQPKLYSKIDIQCKLLKNKKLYIDYNGQLFPCYTYAENNYAHFDANAQIFDLTDIMNYTYPDCFLCSKTVEKMMKTFNLQFIC